MLRIVLITVTGAAVHTPGVTARGHGGPLPTRACASHRAAAAWRGRPQANPIGAWLEPRPSRAQSKERRLKPPLLALRALQTAGALSIERELCAHRPTRAQSAHRPHAGQAHRRARPAARARAGAGLGNGRARKADSICAAQSACESPGSEPWAINWNCLCH